MSRVRSTNHEYWFKTHPIFVNDGGKCNGHGPSTDAEISEGKVPDKLIAPVVKRSVAD